MMSIAHVIRPILGIPLAKRWKSNVVIVWGRVRQRMKMGEKENVLNAEAWD